MTKSDKVERRRSVRIEVLETFHVFLVIPRSGLHKIYLKDVSEHGLGFFAEDHSTFAPDEILEAHFYINPNLKLPLSLRVMHTAPQDSGSKVGCEFAEKSSKSYRVFLSFIRLLDDLGEFVNQ